VDLTDLESAVASFRASSFQLNAAIGELNPADHTLRARAAETARDIFAFCHTFRRLYEEAHADLREDIKLANSRPPEDADTELWATHVEKWSNLTRVHDLERAGAKAAGSDTTSALIVGFKALYLFIRAHQDSLCALAHFALFPHGTATGSHNMTDHLKRDGGHVVRFIRSAVPGYEEWYRRWRDARNLVKEGVSFSTYGSMQEMGIRFTRFIPEGGGVMINTSEGVGLEDVVEALQMSERLQRAIEERSGQTSREPSREN
jgi:hypothetical protein